MSIEHIKHIILVSSGKGGVGKSTVTSNLAASISQLGHTVGVLDADIYGPSQFMMFGLENNQPAEYSENNRYLRPSEAHGIHIISIASSIREDQAVGWRGTMATVALKNLLFNTAWGELDYLIVDMPPGTGDIQISICDILPQSSAVIVTTPQDVALLDCKKGIELFREKNIPICGIVENMSGYICNHCGTTDYIFGAAGGAALAEKYATKLLGKIPINTQIRITADTGTPIAFTPGPVADIYLDIARKIINGNS